MPQTTAREAGPNRHFIGVPGSRTRLNTPALLLDVDRLDRNIARMADVTRAAGIKLRPHAKGHKSAEIARRQANAGAIGLCCTTLGEAEVMADAGIENLLITSPVVSPPMIERLIALNGRSRGLLVVVDNPDNVAALDQAAATAAQTLSAIVEFDVGQRRTGVVDEDAVVALAMAIQGAAHLRYAGLQAYYGHLQHVPVYADRRAAATDQTRRVRALRDRLDAEGLAPELVTGGGTGTYAIDCAAGAFTEIQPGSYPFLDREYTEIPLVERGAAPFEASLFVLATVVSANREGFAVVNAGYKSFATEGGTPVVMSPQLADAKYQLMGDEHGGIRYAPGGAGRLKIGDPVEFLAPHCDPTINLYDRYHCVRGDTLVDIWPVDARGR
jgi:D-serine deaminase-like pyridoxal phosphate-dependent protein